MQTTRTCAQGHRWPTTGSDNERCPICGEATIVTAAGAVDDSPSPAANEGLATENDRFRTVVPDCDVAGDEFATRPSVAHPPHVGPGMPIAVPGYEILAELGRGGMGVVYRARHKELGRVVALKMILSGAHAGQVARARFRTEAQAIARLQHPNIVQVFEVGEQGGLPYFSLEYCSGGSLAKKLAATPLPPADAAGLVETLARAMHVAHQKNIVHRDLKPGNILLSEDGTPKVSDFGLAKKLDEDGGTVTGAQIGTPNYMAPEQAAGRVKELGPACDVYALGAILYECLTGRPPFKAATVLETLRQVQSEEPVSPRQLNRQVPRDMETICLKCLQKDPQRRYASALALADDLRRELRDEPIDARPPRLPERLWRWSRRNPVPASLLVAITLGAAIGLWHLSRLSQSLVRSAALDSVVQQSSVLEDVNNYYSGVMSHMEEMAKGRDLPFDVTADWRGNDKLAMPAPATMTIELGSVMAEGKSDMQIRLYSDYPFHNRKGGGPRDAFERNALDKLQQDPSQPFYSFEDYHGRPVLRYATARVMQTACLHCHNTRHDSPKQDWKTGDVRGVLEIIRPLDQDEARIEAGMRGTFLLVGGVGVTLLAATGLVLFLSNRRSSTREEGSATPAD